MTPTPARPEYGLPRCSADTDASPSAEVESTTSTLGLASELSTTAVWFKPLYLQTGLASKVTQIRCQYLQSVFGIQF